MRKNVLICLFIFITTVAAYYQSANHGFVNLDDSLQLTANTHVISGLTWGNFIWSFSTESPCSPLTWFSYTLIHSLFGLNPGIYHAVSLLIHTLTSLLVFFMLRSMTGETWKSAFVGSLFALHPINVESVAWIAELNNVLSAFFWMLTILLYSRYAKRPGFVRYFLALLVFELGLLAKPILMTLPFVLLLLDYWPLRRIRFGKSNGQENVLPSPRAGYQESSVFRLVFEKIPFLILSVASIFSALFTVEEHTTFTSIEAAPISLRIGNALISYIKYMGKMLWPHDLAVLYPYPDMVAWWHVAGACLLLLAITFLALRSLHKHPYFLVGWLWFLGSLVPFLGIVQGGAWPEMADRYAYVTFIGLFIIIVWGIPDLFKGWRYSNKNLSFAGVGVLIILMAVTWNQLGYWKNSITLFEHVLRVNKICYTAHVNLGNAFADRGEKEKAIMHYREVLRVNPEHPDAHFNLGVIYDEQGKVDEAIEHYSKCLQSDPDKADVHINLGILLEKKGRIQEGIIHYQKALRIDPGSIEAHNNLGNCMLMKGDFDEAINYYLAALQMKPDHDELHNNLGTAYVHKGELNRAIHHFEKAVSINPGYSEAYNNLKNARRIMKTLDNSIADLRKSLKKDPQNPSLYYKLGEVYRKAGDFDEAISQFRSALSLEPEFLHAWYGLVVIYSNRNEYENALGALKEMRQIESGNADIYYNIACVYAKQNRLKESAYWLEQSILKGFHNWNLLRADPDLENIRDTEYFKKLVIENEALGVK